MTDKIKFNRSGKIKSRVFALILLMLSCSLALVAFKSLGRSFNGMIMHKEIHNGFIQKNYDLYINQDYDENVKNEISNEDIMNVLVGKYDEYTKVGVSYFAYEEAEKSMIIKKKKGSPIIMMNGVRFIDQGLVWIILSLIGMFISNLIYKQTLIKLSNEEENKFEEEIEL